MRIESVSDRWLLFPTKHWTRGFPARISSERESLLVEGLSLAVTSQASHPACFKVILLLCLLRLLQVPVLSPIFDPRRDQDSVQLSAILSQASEQQAAVLSSSHSITTKRIKSVQRRRVKEEVRLQLRLRLELQSAAVVLQCHRRTASEIKSGRRQVAAGHQRRRVRPTYIWSKHTSPASGRRPRAKPRVSEQGEFREEWKIKQGKISSTGDQHLSLQETPRLSSSGWIARA